MADGSACDDCTITTWKLGRCNTDNNQACPCDAMPKEGCSENSARVGPDRLRLVERVKLVEILFLRSPTPAGSRGQAQAGALPWS